MHEGLHVYSPAVAVGAVRTRQDKTPAQHIHELPMSPLILKVLTENSLSLMSLPANFPDGLGPFPLHRRSYDLLKLTKQGLKAADGGGRGWRYSC